MRGRCRPYGGVVNPYGPDAPAVPHDADPNPIPSTVRAADPSDNAIPTTIVEVDRAPAVVYVPSYDVDYSEF